VVVSTVRLVDELPRHGYTGFLDPERKALLAADVPGRVNKINSRSGQTVKQGEVLATLTNPSLELDQDVLQARLKEAQVTVADASQRVERTRNLFRQNLTSAEQYDEVQAGYNLAQAKLEAAKAQMRQLQGQLDLMQIRAPIAGEIVLDKIELGQWVTTGTVLYEIYNYSAFELQVGVPAKFINSVVAGRPVKVEVAEISTVLDGRIAAVVRHVSATTGTFTLRIQVDNPQGTPISGLTGRALVPIGSPGAMLAVPRDAVVRRGGSSQIVVVREGKARIVPVEVTGNLGEDVIISSQDVKPEEQVVVRGNERLAPGTDVVVTGTL
jgi:RND family efflux transporter MFP subunit